MRPSEQKGLLIETDPVSLQQDFADVLRGTPVQAGQWIPAESRIETARSILADGCGGGAGSGPHACRANSQGSKGSALSSEARV